MKETPIAACEKQFLLQTVKEGLRVDGRRFTDHRHLDISFGTEWGCCYVILGNTRAMAQVSCSVQVPKASRPNEGMMFVNVEMSTMAAEHFEAGRLGKLGIEVNRLVERCIKDSNCIDLESLCILVEEKAWEVRVDVHLLNHDGNLVDAATLSALGALCHFRRPDVTLDGRQVTIHSREERDPVPLTILHHPLTLTFALFNKGKANLLDPTNLEERCADGRLIMAFNAYKELCTLHMAGDGVFVTKDAVLSCANVAAHRAVEMVALLKSAITKDANQRLEEGYCGLVSSVALEMERVTTQVQDQSFCDMQHDAMEEPVEVEDDDSSPESASPMKITVDDGVVCLESTQSDDSSDLEVVHEVAPPIAKKAPQPPLLPSPQLNQVVDLGDDSEEEPVMLSI